MSRDDAVDERASSSHPRSPATLDGPDLDHRRGDELQNLGYVVVSPEGPDDGGDFGPHTPGTRTAGIREAIEHAKTVNRDVFIVGGSRSGPGPTYEPIVYDLDETLRIPWMQDFELTGSAAYLLKYTGDNDAVVFDSQMLCKYRLGSVWSDGDGAALRVKPETAGPDGFAVFSAQIEFNSLVTHGVVDNQDTGDGLVLDSSEAPIVQSLFYGKETNSQEFGLYLTDDNGAGAPIRNNSIQVPNLNQAHATGECTNLRIGDPRSEEIANNRIASAPRAPRSVYFDVERDGFTAPADFVPPDTAIGAEIHGRNNLLTLAFNGARASGNDLVFGEEAAENLVVATRLPNGMTNHSRSLTNRVLTPDRSGIGVSTPSIPSPGTFETNHHPVPVEVLFLDAGQTDEWTVRSHDGERSTVRSLTEGQTVTLNPGDAVALRYESPPTWCWRGIF